MNKRESSAILLACKKHGIFLTVRSEGDWHLVSFYNKLEVRSFEAAKLITNGLVVENRLKKRPSDLHKTDSEIEPPLNMNRWPKRKERGQNGLTLGERRGFGVD